MANTKLVMDCETGLLEEVEMTAEELATQAQQAAAVEAYFAEQEAQAEAKAVAAASAADKLAKLGLTAEEIAALRG